MPPRPADAEKLTGRQVGIALLSALPTFGLILVALMLQTPFPAPPVGFSLFHLKGSRPKGVTIRDIHIGVIPFVPLQMGMVALCFAFPQTILWLPQQMYGGG